MHIKSRIWCYREFNDDIHKDREPALYQLYMMSEEEVQWLADDHDDRIYFFDSFDLEESIAEDPNGVRLYGVNKYDQIGPLTRSEAVDLYGVGKHLDSDRSIRETITIQGLENAISAIPEHAILPTNVPGVLNIVNDEGKWMVKIHGDGRVELSDDYDGSVSSSKFWDDLMRYSPRCSSRYDVPVVGVVECQLRGPHKGTPHYHSMTGRKSDRFWRWDEEEAVQYLG